MPALNLADPESLHVFTYDLWWPALLIWVAFCISEVTTVLLDITDRQGRLWAVLFLPFVLANVAVHRSQMGRWYADSRSLTIWYVILVVTTTLSLGLGTRIFVSRKASEQRRSRQLLNRWVPALVAGIGLASSLVWIRQNNKLPWSLRPWFVWTVWVTVLLLLNLARLVAMARADVAELPWLRRPRPMADFTILLAMAALVAGLADLFHYGSLDPVWDLAGLIVVFVILVELLGGSPLRLVVERPWLKEILAAEAPLIELLKSAQKQLVALLKGIGNAVKNAFSKPTLSGFVKVILGLIVLSIIAQIPNRGKTVVQSFQPLGLADKDDNKDVGRQISNRVVNTLGLLRQELKPSMTTLRVPGNQKQKAEIRTLDTGEDTSNLEASVKGDFNIPGTSFSLPLSWITDQLQAPFNWALGVRVVHGSVQPKPGGGLLVLARSTGGETWRAPASLESPAIAPSTSDAGAARSAAAAGAVDSGAAAKGTAAAKTAAATKPEDANAAPSPQATEKPTTPPAGQSAAASPSNAAPAKEVAAPDQSELPCSMTFSASVRPGTPVQVAELGDEIAYKLVASDPNLTSAGMATSWEAIPCFRRGLKAWNAYNMSRDPADLADAIAMFRQAIKIDLNFPWAHYYLGLALRADEQPGTAIAEFRTCLQSNPNFHRAAKALAETLYFFDEYSPVPPAELTSADTGPTGAESTPGQDVLDTANQSRIREATQWRQHMVQSPTWQLPEADRAAAYSGLSRAAEDASHQAEPQRESYLAYFYAKRAQHIFANLPSTAVPDPESRTAESYLLANLGVLLENSGTPVSGAPSSVPEWQCSSYAISADDVDAYGKVTHYRLLSTPAYVKAASKYYMRALAIQPQNPAIACLAATNSFILGDHQPMSNLEKDAGAHIQLADQIVLAARGMGREKASRYYQLGLNEYEEAIKARPITSTR